VLQDDALLHQSAASQPAVPPSVAQELTQLRQQVQLQDRLVEQLSTELFRMVKTHPPLLSAAPSSESAPVSSSTPEANPEDALRGEIARLEQQIEFYQSQIDKRDTEITRLQKSCRLLGDRNQMLEQLIQQLPEVYRQKFTDRLDSVKARVQSLQTENRRLSSELQQINARQLLEPRSAPKPLPLPAKQSAVPPRPPAD
jgi:chromosome segregation ATPase